MQRKFSLDNESVAIYHTVGSIPAPKTIYKEIASLEPGSWLKFKIGEQIHSGHHWRLKDTPKIYDSNSPIEILDIIKEKFEYAVKSRIVSDVPLGLFLSGGIDSNAILTTLSRNKIK